MTTVDCITALFCQVDDQMLGIPRHLHASVWPSEMVTFVPLSIAELSLYNTHTTGYITAFIYVGGIRPYGREDAATSHAREREHRRARA